MRQGEDPLQKLTLAAASRDLVVCGVIRCEVGRGIRHPRVRDRFHAVWDVMVNVPTDNRLWAETEQMAWDLDRNGITLPLTDLVIAACARRVGAVVLTFDAHFYDMPGVRVTSELEA
jgi:predicted nucleic acid-binding protein